MTERRRRFAAIAIALVGALAGAWAQAAPPGESPSLLDRGLESFRAERYREALDYFGRLLSDPKAVADRQEAAYWSVLAYMAAGDQAGAERSLDSFLAAWPASPRVPDLLYQRGRLLFQKADYEGALRTFASFMESAPNHELLPSALYWSGEALYALGRLEEAERAFASVVESYPKSVKVEAASYKRSLIRLEYRERELLKLLTWSHEESLRIVEDFRRRERSYEQALGAYQKQIAELKRGAPSDTEKELAELRSQLAELGSKLAAAEAKAASSAAALAASETALKALRAEQAALAAQVVAPLASGASESERIREALLAKSRALDLLALYLEKLSGSSQ